MAAKKKAEPTHVIVPFDPKDWNETTDQSTKVPKGKKPSTGLKIHPNQAQEAMKVLEAYVIERAELAADRPRLGDTVHAIQLMDSLFRFKEEIADRIKSPTEKAYDMLRFNVVPEFMTDEDITNITVDGVGRCNVQDDVQVKVEDKPKLFAWLIENEKEDMIVESVNAQTLTAFVRQRMKAGEELPDGDIIKVTPVVRAAITRSK